MPKPITCSRLVMKRFAGSPDLPLFCGLRLNIGLHAVSGQLDGSTLRFEFNVIAGYPYPYNICNRTHAVCRPQRSFYSAWSALWDLLPLYPSPLCLLVSYRYFNQDQLSIWRSRMLLSCANGFTPLFDPQWRVKKPTRLSCTNYSEPWEPTASSWSSFNGPTGQATEDRVIDQQRSYWQ